MLNEAALITARRNGKKIRMDEIEEAITKVIAGPEKKSRVISPNERKLTAYHEAGHALVARMMPNTDPVHQVSIIPRGRAGGFTMILPKEDKYYATKTSMKEQIVHLLGGRVAEKITLDDISTGASNDIERATDIARAMVTKYGFSDRLGPVNYSSPDEVFLGKDFSTRKNYSEEVASEIDEEIRIIIEDAYSTAESILTENLDKLHTIANTLLEIETLDGEQFEKLFTGEVTAEELIEEVHNMERAVLEANAKEAAELELESALEDEEGWEEDDLAENEEHHEDDDHQEIDENKNEAPDSKDQEKTEE
jgi:cell division protease FtsH